MADITKEVNDFKNAVYGEQVRDSMITLANKVNHGVEESNTSAILAMRTADQVETELSNVKQTLDTKIATHQGVENAGKVLKVDQEGNVYPITDTSAKIVTLWSGQLLESDYGSNQVKFQYDNDFLYDPTYNVDGLGKIQFMVETIEAGYYNWQTKNKTYFATAYFEKIRSHLPETVLPYNSNYQELVIPIDLEGNQGNELKQLNIGITTEEYSNGMVSEFKLCFHGKGNYDNVYLTKISAIIPSKQEVY